jgi:hypothetical protein
MPDSFGYLWIRKEMQIRVLFPTILLGVRGLLTD